MFFTWFCPDYIGFPWFSTPNVLVSGPDILVKLRGVEQFFSGAAVLGPCFPAVQDLVALRQTRAGCEGQTWTDPGMREEWWSWLDVATLGDSQHVSNFQHVENTWGERNLRAQWEIMMNHATARRMTIDHLYTFVYHFWERRRYDCFDFQEFVSRLVWQLVGERGPGMPQKIQLA